MLDGCPLLNSIVNRSYPGCVPVRTALMKATAGACVTVMGGDDAHTKGGNVESGVGVVVGLGPGEAGALGVGLEPTPGPTVFTGRFSGLAMNRTPITTAAITAAATPAIQNGPLCSG